MDRWSTLVTLLVIAGMCGVSALLGFVHGHARGWSDCRKQTTDRRRSRRIETQR